MEANYTAEVKAKPEFHGFLIGRGGATISKVKEGGVRVVFPAPGDPDPELIAIIGKKEAVEKAKVELESQILALVSCRCVYVLLQMQPMFWNGCCILFYILFSVV